MKKVVSKGLYHHKLDLFFLQMNLVRLAEGVSVGSLGAKK